MVYQDIGGINNIIMKEFDSEPVYGDNNKYKNKVIWG